MSLKFFHCDYNLIYFNCMIFNLFKAKPTLKELIPNGFVDIHSHILPGIDDGAKNIEESKDLISKMKKMGFSKIIGTPHTYPGLYNNTTKTIIDSYQSLEKNLKTKIEMKYASEYMIDKSLVEKARNKNLLCIKDNLVLVEMSFISEPLGLYEIIYEIKVNGYIPVLAHPERYLFYRGLKNYKKLKKYGCLFQANLLSTTDYYGHEVRKKLIKLINNELIDFVGSDIHNMRHIAVFENKVKFKEIKSLEKIIENNNQFT